MSGEDEKSATYGNVFAQLRRVRAPLSANTLQHTVAQQSNAEEHSPAFSVEQAEEIAAKVAEISDNLNSKYDGESMELALTNYAFAHSGAEYDFNVSAFDNVKNMIANGNVRYVTDYLKAVYNEAFESRVIVNEGMLAENALKLIENALTAERTHDNGAPTYTILQLKDGDDTRDYRFADLSELRERGLSVERGNYNAVYSGRLANGVTLEDIYTKFNVNIPDDFHA